MACVRPLLTGAILPALSVFLTGPPALAEPDLIALLTRPPAAPERPTDDSPNILDRPLTDDEPPAEVPARAVFYPATPIDPPLGYAGPSGVMPTVAAVRDFLPMEDRWRLGFPSWDRYGNGHPPVDDYPYALGRRRDPFNLNVLKGDYPVVGQHTFLDLSASSFSIAEGRSIPTATTPFESTARPGQFDFFGRPGQFLGQEYVTVSADLSHGDAAFKPADWRVRVSPVFNFNFLDVEELAVVNPDVRKGTQRARTYTALEQYFAEAKLADLGPEYDFVSLRVGSQPFVSDFRGFIFSDINRGARLFGTLNGNRDQFNLVYFRQAEKDTNSQLNTFGDRRQNVVIANYYRQDFLWPGYTAQVSVHYDNDLPSTRYDTNNFLVRPDPVGVFRPHEVDVVYLGWAGDGHVDRYNVTHALYWAVGRDSKNPLANQPQTISAVMAALEVSYDRDWVRFRASTLYSSGDGDVNNSHATGFDTILDNPFFAGGSFGYWQRQAIPLFGVNLVQRESLIPDLRSSKIQGQANFVNPGLLLFNAGMDFDLTPKLRLVNNATFLQFDKTNALETFLFDAHINREIGVDLSTGIEYRPLLSNNAIFVLGLATLIPGQGFKDIYSRFGGGVRAPVMGFLEATLAF
jgi:hypothetical protein